MRIHEILEKCKSAIASDRIFIAMVIIFVGIGSFGLGRLSKIEAARSGIQIEAPAAVAEAIKTQNKPLNADFEALEPKVEVRSTSGVTPTSSLDAAPIQSDATDTNSQVSDGQVVASKSGTKYHFPWCSGAKTISEKNKIWFNSTKEAREAGYTPAANCKGLR